MSLNFNADEIFQMAEQMERNGAKFYRKAAEGISGSPNKEMLMMLADMEDQHEKTFSSMRSELTDPEKATDTFDPQGETALYLKSLVDTRVFFKKEIDVTSLKEILKEAVTAEKDSIVFYRLFFLLERKNV